MDWLKFDEVTRNLARIICRDNQRSQSPKPPYKCREIKYGYLVEGFSTDVPFVPAGRAMLSCLCRQTLVLATQDVHRSGDTLHTPVEKQLSRCILPQNWVCPNFALSHMLKSTLSYSHSIPASQGGATGFAGSSS